MHSSFDSILTVVEGPSAWGQGIAWVCCFAVLPESMHRHNKVTDGRPRVEASGITRKGASFDTLIVLFRLSARLNSSYQGKILQTYKLPYLVLIAVLLLDQGQ